MRLFPQVNPDHFQTKTVLFIQLSLKLWMKPTRVGFVTEIKRYSSFWISCTRKRYMSCCCFSKLYPDNEPEYFKKSTGWLTRFNQWHGIKNVQLRGEILSSDMEAVEPCI